MVHACPYWSSCYRVLRSSDNQLRLVPLKGRSNTYEEWRYVCRSSVGLGRAFLRS